MTVNSKEENSKNFCLDFVQEFDLRSPPPPSLFVLQVNTVCLCGQKELRLYFAGDFPSWRGAALKNMFSVCPYFFSDVRYTILQECSLKL
jgi:hypothetical protein